MITGAFQYKISNWPLQPWMLLNQSEQPKRPQKRIPRMKVGMMTTIRRGKEEADAEKEDDEDEKRQSFYVRLKEKPLAKNDSAQ